MGLSIDSILDSMLESAIDFHEIGHIEDEVMNNFSLLHSNGDIDLVVKSGIRGKLRSYMGGEGNRYKYNDYYNPVKVLYWGDKLI